MFLSSLLSKSSARCRGWRVLAPAFFGACLLVTACQAPPLFSGFEPPSIVAPVRKGETTLLVQPRPPGLTAPQKPFANPTERPIVDPASPLADFGAGRYFPRIAPPELSSLAAQVQGTRLVYTPPGPAFAWSETENILILGTDRRAGEASWRTDSIMIVGLDRTNGRAAILSVPRDLYLNLPAYGWARINQADYIGERVLKVDGGGPAYVSEVLSAELGIRTQHWVRIEMSGFSAVVDAVGGVTINLDCPFYEPIYNLDTQRWEYFTLPAGQVYLDGESAYWFVRLRLRESDIGRAKRQRQFLWALRERAVDARLILRLPQLWSAFNDTFTTDLTLLQMLDYARFGMDLEAQNVRATGITLRDLVSVVTPQGAQVLQIGNPQAIRDLVNSVWDAPAMADAYRKDATACTPIPPDAQAALEAPALETIVEGPQPVFGEGEDTP